MRGARVVALVGLLGSGLGVGTACDGCGRATPVAPAWPAGADLTLEEAIASTASALPAALEPIARPVVTATGKVDPSDAPLPTGPGVRARAFVFEGLWVAEVELGRHPSGVRLPLVMMLHGRGDQPRVPGGPFGRVPTPLRVLVPRGPFRLGEGFSWTRHSVTQGRHHELAEDLLSAAERLARLIAHVRDTRATAGTPIVTGFSQGAMLTWTLALHHDEVGLAMPIAGWVPPEARPLDPRTPPTWAMHGTADPIVTIEPTRAWVAELREHGNAVVLEEFDGVAHTVTPAMNALFETWLERAAFERAPKLVTGLGSDGPDPEPVVPFAEVAPPVPDAEATLDDRPLPAHLPAETALPEAAQ